MRYETFRGKTLAELEEATEIAKNVWSLYLNDKKKMNERTIDKAAEKLGMESGELLSFINRWRKEKLAQRQKPELAAK